MKRFVLSSIWLFVAFMLSFSSHAGESDNKNSISSSPPTDVETISRQEERSTRQGDLDRRDENIPEIEGRWFVKWHDWPEEGKIEQAVILLTKPWILETERVKSGARRWISRRDKEADWLLRAWDFKYYTWPYPLRHPTVSAEGEITLKHDFYFLGHWGGTSVVRQTGPNEMRGQWKYQDNGGVEIWRRIIPKITHIKFLSEIENEVAFGTIPGRVELTYNRRDFWKRNDMRGNRPRFTIQVYGDNLWGGHAVDLCGAEDLEPLGYSPIRDKDSKVPDNVIGITFEVAIWPQFTLGRKMLFFDGVNIPFDFVVKEKPRLRFVRKEQNAYQEIRDKLEFYGEPLCLEARYELKHVEGVKTATLESYSDDDTLQESLEIMLIRTEDPLLYRSEVFYVMPPPIPKEWLQLSMDEELEALLEPTVEP